MAFPLVFLATVTVFAGFIPFGHFVTSDLKNYDIHLDFTVAYVSVIIAVCSIALATILYRKESTVPKKLATTFSGLHNAASHRFYIDEVYLFITKKIIFNNVSKPLAWFDRHVVDGTMNGMAATTQWVSLKIKGFQSGQVQQYAYVFLLGTLVITLLVLFI
jgi:NADH-quinone oxidoreductase subunit L